MIPLRDSVPASRTPVVNYALIALCTLAFVVQLGDPDDELVRRLGMVPARVFDPDGDFVLRDPVGRTSLRLGEAAVPDWLTLLTCTFLHGDWLHFLGNMLFLWIFGDNVEEAMGHLKYLIFYLICGVAAALAQILMNLDSQIPSLGASGAISGVLGAYLVLFPHQRVRVLLFRTITYMPAIAVIGMWIVLQFINGIGQLAVTEETGGVAYAAHIGGFVAGLLLVWVFRDYGGRRVAGV